jgi:aminoglycoside phosphotransferase (APT) family kinase protein
MEQLARLYAALGTEQLAGVLADWDYEAELLASAKSTLAAAQQTLAREHLAWARPALPALHRVVAALPEMRLALLAAAPFGCAVLHGDAHPGNVLLCGQGTSERVVLLDWGRARLGSPLEDVASWLRSLGCWEPAARRRHDTLLRRYLRARGLPDHLGPEVRDAYWLAAACNVLSGALRYHLAVMDGWGRPNAAGRAQAVLDRARSRTACASSAAPTPIGEVARVVAAVYEDTRATRR